MAFNVLLVCTQPYKAVTSIHTSKQASKKTDFTVDLTWWGSLRLAPMIVICLRVILHISRSKTFINGSYINVLVLYLSTFKCTWPHVWYAHTYVYVFKEFVFEIVCPNLSCDVTCFIIITVK